MTIKSQVSNNTLWWLLTTIIGILILSAGGWATEQMLTDKANALEIVRVARNVAVVEQNFAVMEERWRSVDKKLDHLIAQQEGKTCGGK
jgi:hypothetical protein